MAREIDIKESKRLVKLHSMLLNDLSSGIKLSDKYLDLVNSSVDSLLNVEANKVLKTIPIDEINREKSGFRVKTLREAGFETIYDIYSASVLDVAGVRGIGDETAREIKNVASKIAETTVKNTKVRVSIDDKTKEATSLVEATYKYKELLPYKDKCQKLSDEYFSTVKAAIGDLLVATSKIRWFFASSKKKDKALRAFDYLKNLLNDGYKEKIDSVINPIIEVNNSDNKAAWDDFSQKSVEYFNTLEKISPAVASVDDTVYGLPEDLAKAIEQQEFLSDGLNCTLRRYQEWGVKYALHQKRVLLGDEMGLGKTIQAIAVMVSLRNSGATHFLVVCPASVITNWCREIKKMSDLSVIKLHGYDKDDAFDEWVKNGGVAVTTYETTGAFSIDDAFKISLLVVDEAHYIKNKKAQRTENVKAISTHAENILFMTGTALENKVEEMVELIKILQPQIAASVEGMEFLSSAPEFREKVAPVYYRRRREDVLTELPDLIENKEWCTLGANEEKAYEEAVLSKNFSNARRVSWNVQDINDSSKAKRMLEIIEEAEEDGRKIIVFSFFLDTISKVKALLGDKCLDAINGSVPPQRRQEIIDEFNSAPSGTVLAAQIQSGGTGLNIQAASVVILCEPQFKPSIENQAISRAYRMGQTRNVLVYRLLCDETVDERILDMIEEKQGIFDAFADKSVVAEESLEIDEKTFGTIIDSEIKRIQERKVN